MNSIARYARFEETVEPRSRRHMERLRVAGEYDRLRRAMSRCIRIGVARFNRRYDDFRGVRLPLGPL